MTITIRKCTEADLLVLQEISVATYKDTFDDYNTAENMSRYLEEAYNLQKLAQELALLQSEFYFIFADEELAGYLKLNSDSAQTETMPASSLEIERIYVKTAFKRKGIGHRLIAHATKRAREKNKTSIWLGVWEHNQPAKEFYTRMGFNQTGAHSFFMGDDKQTDDILTKDLV